MASFIPNAVVRGVRSKVSSHFKKTHRCTESAATFLRHKVATYIAAPDYVITGIHNKVVFFYAHRYT